MADDINLVILCGTLGADPELRVGQSGASVCKLRVATSKSVKKKGSTEYTKVTEWTNVVIFGKRGEFVASDCSKGSRVTVQGQLSTRSYEDRDGNKKYVTEVVADTVCHERRGGWPASVGGGEFDAPEVGGQIISDDCPF